MEKPLQRDFLKRGRLPSRLVVLPPQLKVRIPHIGYDGGLAATDDTVRNTLTICREWNSDHGQRSPTLYEDTSRCEVIDTAPEPH